MTFRRFVALLVLAAAWWLWRAATRDFGGTVLSPLCMLVAPIIGFLALAVLVFNLRLSRPAQDDSRFDSASERRGTQIGLVTLFLFGAMPIAIGARGVFTGVMPAIGHGPDLVFRHEPLAWLATLLVWIGGGGAVLWLTWKVARHAHAQDGAGRRRPRG